MGRLVTVSRNAPVAEPSQPSMRATLHLAINRRVWRARPCGELGEAQLKVRVSEQQCQDLALLLRPQDRQERRCRSFIRELKNALQFAET